MIADTSKPTSGHWHVLRCHFFYLWIGWANAFIKRLDATIFKFTVALKTLLHCDSVSSI